MKVYLVLFAIIISGLLYSCSKKNGSLTELPPDPVNPSNPVSTVTGFLPISGDIGQVITIKGANFGEDASKVTIRFADGAVVTPKSVMATEIKVEVPATVKSGQITITVNSTTIKTSDNFTFTPIVQVVLPTITGFAPKSVQAGENVTVTGSGFGTELANVAIFLANGDVLAPISVTPLQIVFKMPVSGVSGLFTINVNGKTVSSEVAITVTNPSTDPPTNPPGNTVYTYVKKILIVDNGGNGVTDKNHANLLSSSFNSSAASVMSTKTGGTSRLRLFNYDTGAMKVRDGVIEVTFPNMVKLNRTKVLADTLVYPYARLEEINTTTKQVIQYYGIIDNALASTVLMSSTEFTAVIPMNDFVKSFSSDNQLILNRPR